MHLLPVDEEELDVTASRPTPRVGHEPRHLIGLHVVREFQQAPNRSLDRGDLVAAASSIRSNDPRYPGATASQ